MKVYHFTLRKRDGASPPRVSARRRLLARETAVPSRACELRKAMGPRSNIARARPSLGCFKGPLDGEDTVSVICVVDDDPSIRRALRRLLQSAGYGVEVFASASACLASDWLSRSACLVLDIHLEGMTGFEMCERLVAAQHSIPVIFITAHDDAPTRRRVQEARGAGYLRKPFDAAALLQTIEGAAGPA